MARKLNISGQVKVLDDETFGKSPSKTVPFNESITLDDDQLEEVVSKSVGVGGEVRGELEIRAQLLNSDRIRVYIDMWLYEGTSENTQDLDGEKHFNFLLLPERSVSKTDTVYNTDEWNCDDYIRVTFTAKNVKG